MDSPFHLALHFQHIPPPCVLWFIWGAPSRSPAQHHKRSQQSKLPALFSSRSAGAQAMGLLSGMARMLQGGCIRGPVAASKLAGARRPQRGRKVELNARVWQRKLPGLPEL
ncbi:hypothetical protein Anapl_02504 [Anas platyrhynchos]|uniref:Uncharacterized protein n=1 Tax=Anas platyrhynchos TaxID=8839 RepID=R0JU06_ANAPL|nr:hypothetical protein Anapl_02504 [Anas platyrhynchos]